MSVNVMIHSQRREGPRKRVPVELRIKTHVEVPADWDDQMVTFWLNESSSCADNRVRDLCGEFAHHAASDGGEVCWCERVDAVVIPEWIDAGDVVGAAPKPPRF